MRNISKVVAGLLVVAALASPTLAGITVTSYQTVALTNAYAPLSQAQYFERQALTNVSPAVAEVSGDWMGTNAGGSTITWHWVGSAQAATSTQFDTANLTVTGSGSFAHELTTTAEFVDPRSSTIYAPSSAALYECTFTLDEAASYAIVAQLNQWSQVRLNTSLGTDVFNYTNVTPNPTPVDLSGMIGAGQYRMLVATGVGAPNFPNGANHYARSGSFENLMFIVEVPEPSSFVNAIAIIGMTPCLRKRCACVH